MPTSYPSTTISLGRDAVTQTDLDYEQRLALLRELQAQAKLSETKARLADPLEAAHAADSVARFQARRDVAEVQPSPVTGIRSFVDAPTMTGIRQEAEQYDDPNTAKVLTGRRATNMIDPRVLAAQAEGDAKIRAEQIAAQGRIDAAKTKGGNATGQPSEYSQERARRVIDSVNDLHDKVSRWNSGVGSYLAYLPETDARNFKAQLDTLKSNIAFNELTAMREASKTGGALGQVSDKEGQLLQSALGALDTAQSPDELKAQLTKIGDSLKRWQAAKGLTVGGTTAAAGSNPVLDRLNQRRNAAGR